MNNNLKIAGIIAASCVLASCTTLSKQTLDLYKLKNGKQIIVGRFTPTKAWQCKTIKTYQHNWALKSAESDLVAINSIKHEALKYAYKHRLKVDYIYIHLPKSVYMNSLDLTMFSDYHVYFQRCKTIPTWAVKKAGKAKPV